MHTCVFCQLDKDIIYENEHMVLVYDQYPVNDGHILIISKRHVASFFELTPQEKKALDKGLSYGKQLLDQTHHPSGYNIGINVGEDAGQTIFHLHVHLIPRYKDDVAEPRGGVRGVIPNKQAY